MFDTGFLNKYPYTDFHELNLDWLIRALKEYAAELQNFVLINAIKYADPIQWDITRQYEKNTVVVDPLTGTAYISVATVPAGVALSRTEYWTVIFDLSRFINAANNNFTFRVETLTTTTATFNTPADGWLVWNQELYRAKVNITAGDAYVINGNIERIHVEDMLQELATTLQNITGDLNDLNTTDKTNLVAAINEVLSAVGTVASDLANTAGNLNDLNTTDKSNLVAAINEVLSAVGTVASALVNTAGDLNDLNTTDKTNLVAAINEVLSAVGTVASDLTTIAGDLNDLNTTDKTNLVAAINEVLSAVGTVASDLANIAGDLNDLNTTDKSNLVAAINEVLAGENSSLYVTPEQFGAVGDGVHDDTQAFRDAIATGMPVKLKMTYPTTYLITDTIDLDNKPLIMFGMERSQTFVKYEGAGYLFDNVGNTSRISEIAFTGISTNNFMSGTVYNYFLDNVTIHYFDRAIYCSRDDWTGYNRFSRVHFDHCNDVYSLVTRSRTQNMFTFDNCEFLDIARIFNVGQVEAWSFNGCTFERVDDVFNVTAQTELWSVNLNGGYFEATHVIRDNGYPVKGSVNFIGGWIWHGTASAQYLLQITRATDDYRLVINLTNMAIRSDGVLFDLTDKVRGTFEGYTYNSSGTGILPDTLYTNTGAQVIKTYDDKRFKYSLPLESYIKFASSLPATMQSTGMVTLDTSGNNLLFNIGQGSALPYGRLIPTIVSSNSLSDVQSSASTANCRYCFGIVLSTGKLYVKIDNTWYEITKTAI